MERLLLRPRLRAASLLVGLALVPQLALAAPAEPLPGAPEGGEGLELPDDPAVQAGAVPTDADPITDAGNADEAETTDDEATSEDDERADDGEADDEQTDDEKTDSNAEDDYVNVPFNIGLLHPLSINGKGRYRGKRVRNNVSLGILANRAARVDGITASFGVTVTEELGHGLAFGMVGNINRGRHVGVQGSMVFNTAQTVEGAQWTVGVNHAKQVKGGQFGLVNVGGDVRGVQVGLINVAKSADASFALIPVTKEGGFHPEFWTSDTALLNVGFRLPARYTYAFASVGLHPIGRTQAGRDGAPDRQGVGRGWEFGGGFGGHIPIAGGAFVDLDIAGYGVVQGLSGRSRIAPMSRARLLVGYSFFKRLTVFGGPTFTAIADHRRQQLDRPGYGWVSKTVIHDDVRVRMWPGFAAGLRF